MTLAVPLAAVTVFSTLAGGFVAIDGGGECVFAGAGFPAGRSVARRPPSRPGAWRPSRARRLARAAADPPPTSVHGLEQLFEVPDGTLQAFPQLHLVVLDGGEVAGILSVRDIVRCWARQRADELLQDGRVAEGAGDRRDRNAVVVPLVASEKKVDAWVVSSLFESV